MMGDVRWGAPVRDDDAWMVTSADMRSRAWLFDDGSSKYATFYTSRWQWETRNTTAPESALVLLRAATEASDGK